MSDLTAKTIIGEFLRRNRTRYEIVIANAYILGSPFESDILRVRKSGFFVEYEVKTSRADFRNDFNKRTGTGVAKHDIYKGQRSDSKRTKLPIPKQFYFLTPEGLIDDADIPDHCGLIEVGEPRLSGYLPVICRKTAPNLTKPTRLDNDQLFNLAFKASRRLTWQITA